MTEPARSFGVGAAGGKPGGRSGERRPLDFYATPAPVTRALIETGILQPGLVWECACGDGAMARVLELASFGVVASDLADHGYGESGVDFTRVTATRAPVIVSNPPFGPLKRFVLRAISLDGVEQVAFVVKATWLNAADRAELLERHPPAYWLPITWRVDFTGGGNSTMDLCWAVWEAPFGPRATILRPLRRHGGDQGRLL